MTPVRVLVVEDSLTVRKWLVEGLAGDPDLEVVGEAADGPEAIRLCQELRPDVVSLDLMLPGCNALAVTEHLMAYCPTPIVILSSAANRADLVQTYDALAAGAVDVVEKPPAEAPNADWLRRYAATLRLVSRIRVITHPRAKLQANKPLVRSSRARPRAIAIGASTGGPAAVRTILGSLPASFPLPILLVIHLAEAFSLSLAQWLSGYSPLPVSFVHDDEPLPEGGRVLMAPPGAHLVLEKGRVGLSTAPARHSCLPSVDVLFESVARELGAASAGCLLTGMGRDGAAGLLAIRQAGGVTIAQDEATSVVHGMPREAIRLEAAAQVLPLDSIAPALVALARREIRHD